MQSFRITRAEVVDAPIVRRIMQEAFAEYRDVLKPPSGSHSETVRDVERAIGEGGAVLVWDGPTAVASARFQLERDFLDVGRVGVLPMYRRRGIASMVMAWMEDLARETGKDRVQVGVRMSLPSNLTLYQKLGYDLIDVQPHPKGPDRVGTLVKKIG